MLNELLDHQDVDGAGATAAHTCSNCGAAMAEGAVICVSCGTRSQGGQTLAVNLAAHEPAKNRSDRNAIFGPLARLAGPLALAIIPSILWIVLFIMAKHSDAAFGIFVLAAILACGAYLLWLYRAAANDGGSYQNLCFSVPLYFLYFVFGVSTRIYLRAATIQYVVCITFLLMLLFGPKPQFKRPMTEWEKQMATPTRPSPSQSTPAP